MNRKFVMSFSGGKDSVLALYRMVKMGNNPIAILTTTKKNEDTSWTHGLKKSLLERVSESLNIPLLTVPCDVCEYEKLFEETLMIAKKMGAEICAYGDIDIEHHKQWGVDRCKNVDMDYVFPLWQENREILVNEFIDSGFITIINKVNLNYMGEEFLGKKLTKRILEEIKLTGSDVCGENGEYHTFVVDGPLYKHPIDFKLGNKLSKDGYGHLEII